MHACYGEYEASVGLDGELPAGSMPRRQLRMIAGWPAFREEEAYRTWNHAVQGERFDKIPPMQQERRHAMYTKDDVCHAGELTEGIKVDAAKLLRGGMLLVTFSTGEKRLFDSTKLKSAAFAPLADERVLGDFEIFHGVMTLLNGEIDIAPEAMYRDSYPYPEEAA